MYTYLTKFYKILNSFDNHRLHHLSLGHSSFHSILQQLVLNLGSFYVISIYPLGY
jgi:hypothetical protein